MPVWSILIAPLAASVLCVAGSSTAAIRRISAAGAAATLGMSGWAGCSVLLHGPISGGGLRLDALGVYLALIASLLSFAASLASGGFMEHEAQTENLGLNAWRVYYALLHLFTTSMLWVSISNNLGFLWIAVEATTLSSAFLVGFHRHHHSVEAAWKYVILCSVGIAFALFGTILLYYAGAKAGNGHSLDWTAFMEAAPRMDPRIVRLAFLFAFLGYGTKAGFAPMHTWLPDAHSQAPSPISAMLSGVLLTAAFYALMRFHAIAARCLGPAFPSRLFLAFGLLSLALAAPFILAARDYKRMLAYSSVEHMGLMSLALGIGSRFALYGMLLHLLCHALAKGLAFMSSGLILRGFGTRKITKVSGALSALPAAGVPFLAAVLALSGLPPFGIFTSELIILSEAFAQGRLWTGLAALALLGVIFAGLFYHALRMSFGPAREGVPRIPNQRPGFWEWTAPAACFIAVLALLGFWIPGPLDRWLMEMARIIEGAAYG
ncbi:MAG: hypothetical protein A3G41_07590 [Elusimicrobia bacterium RIFCSPLOWO2_12_FULL_59_9]|nr:MAG: hypothetical protein A3G41_07590 [Elusimicrobia bacterium RIFCSPLOWO2_12_FULL_59_9]